MKMEIKWVIIATRRHAAQHDDEKRAINIVYLISKQTLMKYNNRGLEEKVVSYVPVGLCLGSPERDIGRVVSAVPAPTGVCLRSGAVQSAGILAGWWSDGRG